jgi:hypothetical protein
MTPQEVLARHQSDNDTGQEDCVDCSLPWPCDAVDQARQLQEAQERLARLEAAVEGHLEACGSIYNERLALRTALAQPPTGDAK